MHLRYLLALFPVFGLSVSKAQLPVVDITLVQLQPDRYEVRLRPDATFNGFFSSLVFTLRWSSGSSATLAEFVPTADMEDIGIFPTISGELNVVGPYNYAVFAAFGNSTLASQGQAWTAGQEVVLGTVQVIDGTASLELINDDWTAPNNADFFVSLNGLEQTGLIYSTSTSLDEASLATDQWEVSCLSGSHPVQFAISSKSTSDVTYAILDAAGRMVDQGRTTLASGRNELTMRSVGPASGAYTIRIQSATGHQASKHLILP